MSVYPILFSNLLCFFQMLGWSCRALIVSLASWNYCPLRYLALPRSGWSSKGYIICKALRDRAGRKTLLLISYPFFLSRSLYICNMGCCFFVFITISIAIASCSSSIYTTWSHPIPRSTQPRLYTDWGRKERDGVGERIQVAQHIRKRNADWMSYDPALCWP